VFVTAAFAYGGTELAGLAAAEAEDPAKSLPKACRQVFWRISFFYSKYLSLLQESSGPDKFLVVNLFLVGLIVPSDSKFLLGSSGANTKASPFVVALQNAGVKGLPSVFNAVITIAVLSVANSATFGSTRTFQALAAQGMAPKILAYVDHAGRPVTSIILQLAFALLAFINEDSNVGTQFFNWLLALSGLSSFFTWGSICWAHLRFRRAWHHNNRSIDELPYVALFGVYGSMFGLTISILCIIATFYVSLFVSRSPVLDLAD
jgi:amino acid transporter